VPESYLEQVAQVVTPPLMSWSLLNGVERSIIPFLNSILHLSCKRMSGVKMHSIILRIRVAWT